METNHTINIMLGHADPTHSNELMKRLKIIRTKDDPTMNLDIKTCQTLAECQRTLSKKAHLMLMDFKDSLIESEAEKNQIREFCRKYKIINVSSEEELLMAIGLMNKGIWNYIRP